MSLLWHSICFVAFFSYSVYSDTIESIQSKPGERTEISGSHQLAFDSNIYPTQSLHNSNGYNSNPNSLLLSESNSESQNYNSGHQTNDQLDKKEQKTLILAIPVKLSLPKSEENNYDQTYPQSSVETHQYSRNPYPSQYSSAIVNHLSRHQPLLSADSDDSNSPKSLTLPPLSQKIYSSIESQLKSASYSTVNTQKSNSEQPSSLGSTNEHKYRTEYETKDHKFSPNHYERNVNTYRSNPIREENKGLNNEGYDQNYGTDKYKINKNGQLANKYVEDSYEDRVKQRDVSKQMYDTITDSKPEYDYDSEDEEEEEDNKKFEDNYYSAKDYNNNKKGFNLKNFRKNHFNPKKIVPKPDVNPLFFKNNKENAQMLPVFAAEPLDEWTQYYLSKVQTNSWPRLPESTDNNLLTLLNQKNLNKDNLQNPMYSPAFDLFTDSQLKSASNPIAFKTLENSKIYGPAAKYQSSYPPLNLFTGFGRDYSLIDLNGDLYPAPLVAQTTPLRKQHNLLKPNEYKGDHNSANRDLIQPHRRNPLLLRPSFMSGLRSAASKPLANFSPFTSASTTHSLLSVLPSLPSLPSLQTSFNINSKSIPRQIFPLLYG